MGRRHRTPSLACAALWLCIPSAIVLAFLGVGNPELQDAVRAAYMQSGADLSPIWALGSPLHPLERWMRSPERFVIVPSESTVAYHVTETFLTRNESTEIIGITHAIQSEITIDRANVRNTRFGTVTVDISTLQSDNIHRDNAIRAQWLESARYPIAEFTPVEIRGLPASYPEGRTIPLEVIGNLRMHGVVRPARLAMQITLHGNTLVGHGTLTLRMAEFGVQPPSLGVLRVGDQVRLDLRFTARRVDLDASAHRRGPRGISRPTTSPNPAAHALALSAFRGALCGIWLAMGSSMVEAGTPSEGQQQVGAHRPGTCDRLGAPGPVELPRPKKLS